MGPKVYSTSLWMILHGAESSKRTSLFSNMVEIGLLDLGSLTKSEKEKRTSKALTRTSNAYSSNTSLVQKKRYASL